MDGLRTILEDKSIEVAEAKRRTLLGAIRHRGERTRGLRDFRRGLEKQAIAIITEIKKATHSIWTIDKFGHS